MELAHCQAGKETFCLIFQMHILEFVQTKCWIDPVHGLIQLLGFIPEYFAQNIFT
jgi:hypothetical protein